MRNVLCLAAAAVWGCAAAPPAPLNLERHETAAGISLILHAEPGARINARLKPALELVDGTVLRFDATALSPDSAYFAEAPSLVLPAPTKPNGTIRASVCRADEHVCRMVVIKIV